MKALVPLAITNYLVPCKLEAKTIHYMQSTLQLTNIIGD